jgi:hypothetical protein
MMGGGPSPEQLQAAQSQTQLNDQLGAAFGSQQKFMEAQQGKVNPFYTGMMQGGLPYYNNMVDAQAGNTAQAFAPAKAQLERTLGQNANALPSGFATGARTDLAAQQGRAFDQGLQGAQGANFQAKQMGAAGLQGQAQAANPTAYSGQATQGNVGMMNAPLARPGLGGLLGGIAGGLASAIPF